MKIKNEKGITLITLVITVIVLVLIAAISISEVGDIITQVNKETICTDMLLIQAKSKVLNEKANFNKDETMLAGQKLSEVTGNSEVDALKTNGIISESEENYSKYYIWNKQTVEEQQLGLEKFEDTQFYIVNYATEEVIYPQGYEHTDGNTYYKLSELLTLEY